METNADFEMLSLAAVTRNVVAFLKLDSPGAEASVTKGSLSPEGRELSVAPGERETKSKEATPATRGLGAGVSAAGAHPSLDWIDGTGLRENAPDRPCDLPGTLSSLEWSAQPTEGEMTESSKILALAAIVGQHGGANSVAWAAIIRALVQGRSLEPQVAAEILKRYGDNMGPDISRLMRLQAAKIMAQKPRRKRGRA